MAGVYKYHDRLLPKELHDLLHQVPDSQKLLWEQIKQTEYESYCPHLEYWDEMDVCERCGFHKCPECEKLFTQFDIPGPQVCRNCSGDSIEDLYKAHKIAKVNDGTPVKCLKNDHIELYFDIGLEYISYGEFNARNLVLEDRFGSIVIVKKERFR